MTDADGDLVQHYGYMPFGDERYQNNTQAFSVTNRYTGQQLDEETGLYFYGSRYYDAELGRFIQPDTIVQDASSQSLNRYTYCVNNPLKFTDPTGHFISLVIAAFVSMMTVQTLAYVAATAFISGAITAAQGGNFWRGVANGAMSAGFSLVVGPVAGGALGALVTGGDPGMAAATAGIASGVSIAFGINPAPGVAGPTGGEYLKELAISTGVGALAGGISAEISGGSFGEGAMWGAASAAASYTVGRVVEDYLDSLESQGQNQELVVQMCNIDIEMEAYYDYTGEAIDELFNRFDRWIDETAAEHNALFESEMDKKVAALLDPNHRQIQLAQ
ncbi:MAG: RHS repeat-associated core domain-containing protein, partial [Phycisphaerae bacterium]